VLYEVMVSEEGVGSPYFSAVTAVRKLRGKTTENKTDCMDVLNRSRTRRGYIINKSFIHPNI
jgi:hypothetical protein